MNIKKLLKQLEIFNLPKDEYVLVGSAPLAIRGIRDAQDLDVIVSDKLWQTLSQNYPVVQEASFKKISLKKDLKDIELIDQYLANQNVS